MKNQRVLSVFQLYTLKQKAIECGDIVTYRKCDDLISKWAKETAIKKGLEL